MQADRPAYQPNGISSSPSVVLAISLALIFWSFYRKHALQNIQNDCHQLLSHSFRVHHIGFRLGLRPGPRWWSL